MLTVPVSSPFEDLSDIGSPGVDGLPMMPEDPYSYVVAAFQAPPSLNYVPGPEEPEQTPLPPKFALEPVYPEFMPPEYEDPADYPANGGDDDNDDDESSDDDEDDNDDVEDDKDEDEDEEEEEHLSLADFIPPPVHRVTARMSIRDQPPTPFWSEAEIDRLLAIPSPLPLPLSPLSSPLPQIPSPPIPVSPPLPISPLPLPASPTYPLGYRDDIIRLRAEAGVSEVTLPPRKRLCIALGLRYKARPREREVGYRITDTWDDMVEDMQGTPAATDMAGLSQRMTDFVMTVRQDTNEIYGRLDDAQDDKLLMSGQLNMLHRDRRNHAHTARLMETEAKLSREAWVQSMDASDTARSKVKALRTTVLAQQTKIEELQATDYKRQTQLTKTLTLMRTLQTQVTALQSQQGPTSSPTQPEILKEAGSSS
ncbi:hypothetical protein Tco_1280994 [Tanacetum coccineum]